MTQAEIDNTVNRPNLLDALQSFDNELTSQERLALPYDELAEYFTRMVYKPLLAKQAEDLGLTITFDQTYDDIETKIVKKRNDISDI